MLDKKGERRSNDSVERGVVGRVEFVGKGGR